MEQPKPESFRRPGWNEAAIWMGMNWSGWWRLMASNRFRVSPAFWLEAAIDGAFAAANSGLGLLNSAVYSRRIARTPLDGDPIFIIGHWRTGTTLLHELLALDERLRFPTTFECFLPNHFLLTERMLKSWSSFVLPPTRPFDNMQLGWDLPQEDEFALVNLGLPSPYLTVAFPNHPPQCQDYLELDGLSPRAQRRWENTLLNFLRQLTLRRPGRILLKSPTHTFRIPTLLKLFPDARFIHLVRNPYDVFPSTLKLWRSLYAVHGYQKPTYADLEEHVLATYCRLHDRLNSTRSLIAPKRFHELRYEDLVRDPAAQLRRIYERLDLGSFAPVEPPLANYLATHAGYQPNRHILPPEVRSKVTTRWRSIIHQYGYPD